MFAAHCIRSTVTHWTLPENFNESVKEVFEWKFWSHSVNYQWTNFHVWWLKVRNLYSIQHLCIEPLPNILGSPVAKQRKREKRKGTTRLENCSYNIIFDRSAVAVWDSEKNRYRHFGYELSETTSATLKLGIDVFCIHLKCHTLNRCGRPYASCV
jgi:hypothetical protein